MSQAGGKRLPDGRVALLFTDVQGSTALLQRLGDAYGEVLDQHDRILRGVWAEFDGVEVDNEGDAFFVAFTDHQGALEAVTAAQQRLAAAAWPEGEQVKVRMALHSGLPAIRGRKYWGVDVHYAARLVSAAHGGQVLLSADMRAQVPRARVQDLGTHGLKDFPAGRQLFHLVVDGTSTDRFPPPRTMAAVRSNLPTIDTPIIGREEALADLRARLLGSEHVITLVGPGGIGKTRTAVAVAEGLTSEFPDGTAFVAMASFRDAAEVPEAIVEAIEEDLQGVDASTALAAHLRDRSLLLVLDNAEHLTGLAEVLAPLVGSSAGTRWLVTSQSPLGMRAEVQHRLDSLTQDAAVELFLERAQARQPGFEVPAEEQDLLISLCRDLDGMPLALELAAARAPTLGVARLLQALGTDPDAALGHGPVDLPERQRGLQAALDWTVSLLSELEREAYLSCGAFAEAWSIDDMEFMLEGRAEPVQVWDALARLLDLSLAVQRGDGRFTMPERVRRHAAHALGSGANAFQARRRHAELVLDTVARLVHRERLVRFRSAMAEVEDHLPEMHCALAWAAANDSDTYRMLLGSAGWSLGWFGKATPWLEDLIRFARSPDPGDLAQARVWGFACTGMAGGKDPQERRVWLDAALTRFLELGDHRWVCEMYVTKFEFEAHHAENIAAGLAALSAGREYAEAHDLPGYVRLFADTVAVGLIVAGDYDEAELIVRRWPDEPGVENWARAGYATFLGDCSFGKGAYAEAVQWYAEDLRGLARSDLGSVLMQVAGISASCAGLGSDQLAVELTTAIEQIATAHQLDLDSLSIQSGAVGEYTDAARLRLRPAEVEAASARGERLDYDALIERALEIAAEAHV